MDLARGVSLLLYTAAELSNPYLNHRTIILVYNFDQNALEVPVIIDEGIVYHFMVVQSFNIHRDYFFYGMTNTLDAKVFASLETKNPLSVSPLVVVSPINYAIRIKFFCGCVVVCSHSRQQKIAETENDSIKH